MTITANEHHAPPHTVLLGQDFKVVGAKEDLNMPHRILDRPLSDGVLRVADASREWLPAIVAAIATWQMTEAFAAFLFFYLPLAAWDYVLGGRGREWDPVSARNGLNSKGVTVTVACVLHGVGFLAQRYGIAGVPAPLGVFFVVGMIISEARSVNKHNKRLTGEAIPYLGPALEAVEAAQERMLYGPAGRPERRRSRGTRKGGRPPEAP